MFSADNFKEYKDKLTPTLKDLYPSEIESYWQKKADKEFGISEKHFTDKREWKDIYHFMALLGPDYAHGYREAFEAMQDDEFVTYESPEFTRLEHAKLSFERLTNFKWLEHSFANDWYIFQYLIKKTDFLSTIRDLNEEEQNSRYYTPMHILAHANRGDLIREIHKVNPNLLDVIGYEFKTPLHVAAEEGALGAALTLLSLGANPLAGYGEGHCRTPFQAALVFGKYELFPLLSKGHPPLSDHEAGYLPHYAGFNIDDSEDMDYKQLFKKELAYLEERKKLKSEDILLQNEQKKELKNAFLKTPLQSLDEEQANIKNAITWLMLNPTIDGKKLMSKKALKEGFSLKPKACKVYEQHTLFKQNRNGSKINRNIGTNCRYSKKGY